MASKSNSSSSTTATTAYDQRIVAGEGAFVQGAGAGWLSADDNSTNLQVSDSSRRSWTDDNSVQVTDASSRSWSDASVTNVTGTDPGLVQMAQLQAELAGAAIGANADAVKFVAQLGTEGIRAMGGSINDLYSQAGSNTGKAWTHTVDKSAEAIDKMLSTASTSADAAAKLATVAINSYQPADNKQADTSLRLGMLAAAAVAALVIIPKLTK